MARLRTFAVSSVAVSIALSILILSTLCFAAAPDRITKPIVAGQTVRLGGGVPLKAQPQFDRGSVDPTLQLSYITLLTVPSAAQKKALSKLLADQQNPHSALYHKWLTPEQYADRFGLSTKDLNKLIAWLQAQGFDIVNIARGRNWIAFSGTAAQAEKAFQTQIHTFRVDDKIHFANITPPVIPAVLSGIVAGFRGLDNFRPEPHAIRSNPDYTISLSGHTFHFLAPGDIATMYDINPLYAAGIDGTGQQLAVMGQTDVYLADLNDFRSGFGIDQITNCTTNLNGVITSCGAGNFQYIAIGTDPGYPNYYGDDLPEADIDLEWSNAAARAAQIVYVNAPETANGIWDSWYYAVDNNVAPVITLSYGLCELAEAYYGGGSGVGSFASDETELQKANSEGITFINSSGDQGAASCDYRQYVASYGYAVSYPASSPEVTGVGGTLIPYNEYTSKYWSPSNGTDGGSALSYIPENGWNDAQEWSIYCTNNSSASVCKNNPGLNNWQSAQENYVGIWTSGGGVSNCVAIDVNGVCQSGFAQPPWQAGISASAINPSGAGVINGPARYAPDVSLLSSIYWPGYILCLPADEVGGGGTISTCDPGGPQGIINNMTNYGYSWGGTSVAAPIFAGIVTLLNQYAVENNLQSAPGLGNINPSLYLLAGMPGFGAFHPITFGSDGAFCTPGSPDSGVPGDPWPAALQCPNSGFLGFDASHSDPSTGYNLVAGLGSVDATNLINYWSETLSPQFTLANTGVTSQSVLAGQTATGYSFTVAAAGGATKFISTVRFSCNFQPADPTLTNSSCIFNPPGISAGTDGTQPITVTLSIVTEGPNPNPSRPAQKQRRADNRLPWLPLTLPIAGILFAGVAGRKVSKYSLVASLCLALVLLGLLVACGGGSSGGGTNPPPQISVSVSGPANIYPNYGGWQTQTAQFTATVHNDSSAKGVTWTASNGTIDSNGLFTAPPPGSPSPIIITATSVANSSKKGNASIALNPTTVPNDYNVTVSVTEAQTQNTLGQTLGLSVQ